MAAASTPTASSRAFAPSTSKPRSELGPIEGADIVDWPVDYDEMEPYYAEAERLIGVAGEAGANPFAEWRSGPYPMPAGADMFGAILTTEAATRLGYHPYRAPTGVNSVPYDGRPACNNCGFCAYYGCPIEAKGDPIAPLRNALRTGRCEIRPDAYVERVLLDATGKQARGVRYIDIDGNAHEVSARVVVVAGGAWETPRLLLRSEIANSSDLVGRYLMYHFQTFVIGQFPFRLHGHRGRAVTHLHDDHMIVDDDVARLRPRTRSPLLPRRAHRTRRRREPRDGRHLHRARHRAHPRDARVERCATGCGRSPCRAKTSPRPPTASTSIRPCATCTASPPGARPTTCIRTRSSRPATTRRNSRPSCARPARSSRSPRPRRRSTATARGNRSASMSRHIMGTCRMGDDPATSVVDRWQRFHDVENMVCTDSSVFPTSTGYGPTLTIVALAIRACRDLAGLPAADQHPPSLSR